MINYKRIKVGKRYVEGLSIKLLSKNFVLLRGSKGYVMCGYLNMSVARKLKDVAIKIVGVASIEDALKANVHSLTNEARELGIYKGQSVKEALRVIV